jgi:small subunit ribosomal protein S6
VKKYEGLFILNLAGKEEGVKEMIDKLTHEIEAVGGKVETTQKMDKRSFARVTNKRESSGFYVNFIFDAPPGAVAQLQHRLALNTDVNRVLFTLAQPPKEAKAAAVPAA